MGSNPNAAWAGKLFLAPGLVLYIGGGGPADRHAHHAVQVVWARDGELEVEVDGRPRTRVRATIIPANTTHVFDASALPLMLMLVDAYGQRGTELNRLALDAVGEDIANRFDETRASFPDTDLSPSEAAAWSQTALAALGVATSETRAPSRQTRRAITYIEQALDAASVPRITEAAELASVSATRLTHRFTLEIGLPFRRFVLWMRVKRAVLASRNGGGLTEAAIAAGFSDAAHLSRTFRAMFGLSPSMVLPFVQLIE